MSTVLGELADVARTVLASTEASVVRIGSGAGRGCGVVVADGVVATNAHNLRGRTTTVTFGDGRSELGEVAAADIDSDLAVLRVDTAGAPSLDIGSATVRTGDVVFAVTRAAGGARVSFGMVSGTAQAFRGPRGRRIRGSIEHTAPLPRGSSGSPVIAVDGTVVGLSTHRVGEGFYLALTADEDLRARLDALAAGRSRQRPSLGVALAPSPVAAKLRQSAGRPDVDGLLVRSVENGSPADAAGLADGDLLVAAGGQALRHVDDLYDVLDAAERDGSVALTVLRGAEERTVDVRFAGEA